MANHTILLIDYEPRSIERFRQPLTGAGYRVEIATDGIAGVEAFAQLNPDMVLVEAMIPKKHGFEVCQELKRTPHGRRTPIIITTSVYKGRKYRTQALHIYGCDEYIEKPIAAEQLLSIVERFLGSSASASREAVAATVETAEISSATPDSPRVASEPSGARSAPHKSSSVPKAVVSDLTEDEIMARLDAILPGVSPLTDDASTDLPSLPPVVLDESLVEPMVETDPFKQMQAELTAELGTLSTALAIDPAPALEPVPEPIPSDQSALPSLLESLPAPEIPLAPPVEPALAPGQVVSFDVKRSRKNKKGRKSSGPAGSPDAQATPSIPLRAPEPSKAAREMGVPSGTLVESALSSERASRGIPTWAWILVAAVALVVVYFVFLSGGAPEPERTAVEPPASSTEPPADPAPVPTREAEPVDREVAAQGTRPAEAQGSERRLVLNAVGPQPARTEPPPPVALPKPTSPPAPRPSADPRRTAAVVAPSTAPSSVTDLGPVDAGVEAITSPAEPLPRPTTQPGALLDIAEVDTPPASLSRKLPAYSMQARQLRLQGNVVMRVLVNERGTVDQVVVVNGVDGAALNDAAVKAAKQWTYRPATKDGVPVKVWTVEQVTFKLY